MPLAYWMAGCAADLPLPEPVEMEWWWEEEAARGVSGRLRMQRERQEDATALGDKADGMICTRESEERRKGGYTSMSGSGSVVVNLVSSSSRMENWKRVSLVSRWSGAADLV
eukprot:747602-Hanusia_phi.AAC.2